jgi:sugar phosphate isomerase/epimerase
MHAPSRREFLRSTLAAGVALPVVAPAVSAWAANIIIPPQLGFSLYGMKGLPLDEAIRTCKEIGYVGVELALLPGYPTDPTVFGKADRKQLRDLLAAVRLKVPALMENLVAAATETEHKKNLDRIARAAELARELYPDGPLPILETVLGGKPADWPMVRGPMTERLRDWAETARKHDLVVAIKPHVSGAVHRPESCRQLLGDVASPHLQAVYDFSHYQVQELEQKATFQTLADKVVFVHVKDGRRVDGKVQFLLPGEGDVDYTALFTQLIHSPRPFIPTVEVSGQIFNRPEYDPRAAAKRCFQHLSTAWKNVDDRPR